MPVDHARCSCGAPITRAPGAGGPLAKRCPPCKASAIRDQKRGTARRARLRRRIPACVACGGSVRYSGVGRRPNHCTACLAAAVYDRHHGVPLAALADRFAFASVDAACAATRRYAARTGQHGHR